MTPKYAVTYRRSDGAIVGWSTHYADAPFVSCDPSFGVTLHDSQPDREWDRVDLETGHVVDTSDKAFAAALERKWQHIANIHPQLLDAVPPEPIQRQSGTFSFDSEAVWQECVDRSSRGELSTRRPPQTIAGLVGPFRSYGGCLVPLSYPGTLHWCDPAIPARDGDFVLVRWDPRVLEGIYKRNADQPDWFANYSDPNPLATKLLRSLGNEYWLLTNSGMFKLGSNRILGVMRWRETATDVPVCEVPNIAPNAATVIYESTLAGPATITAGNTGAWASVGFTAETDCTIQATATMDVETNNAGLSTESIYTVLVVAGTPFRDFTDAMLGSDAQRVTFSINTSALAGQSVAGQVGLLLASASNITASNVRLRVEVIKR